MNNLGLRSVRLYYYYDTRINIKTKGNILCILSKGREGFELVPLS